jgi:hypothetical protein
MKIREEDRNMVLLATVALLSASIAGGLSALKPAAPVVAGKKPVPVADSTPVRVVGAPFIPNTNPRER